MSARRLLTTQDAAHLCGVTLRTIRAWISDGHLPVTYAHHGKRRVVQIDPAHLVQARRDARQRAGRPPQGLTT